jgi:hypothetical protein
MMCAFGWTFVGIIIGAFGICLGAAMRNSGRLSHAEEYGAPEGDVTRIRETA